ncbi:acyl-CoA dehydrogenase C-terminal domain-containing protein [Williamsia sp. CHRR-6]|nr:acyl-CoA dehydrogenase C-terminal domain-containing protein [Williamsia sp. CHRR-6]
MNGGAGLKLLISTITATIDRAEAAGGEAGEFAAQLRAATERLATVTLAVWSAGDVKVSLANSTVYLEAAGHVVVAWIWLEQLLAVGVKQGDFYDGKRAAARYFYRFELPKTGPQFDLLQSLDRTTLDTEPAWL